MIRSTSRWLAWGGGPFNVVLYKVYKVKVVCKYVQRVMLNFE